MRKGRSENDNEAADKNHRKLSGYVLALALPTATNPPRCQSRLSNWQIVCARPIECRFGTKYWQVHFDSSDYLIWRSDAHRS